MKEFVGRVEVSLKGFFKDKINTVITLNVISFTVLLFMLNHNSMQINAVKKRVDFRYFNLTRSIEDIHSVEIETKQGRIIKHFEVK